MSNPELKFRVIQLRDLSAHAAREALSLLTDIQTIVTQAERALATLDLAQKQNDHNPGQPTVAPDDDHG